ncbi:MAG: hypothetical protein ABI413_14890 [Ktedonobacteraceae bacterium]
MCLIISLSSFFSACSSASNQPPSVLSATHTPPGALTPSLVVSPTPTVPALLRPDLERGMIYPRFNQNSYGTTDSTWQNGIQTVKNQTGSTWLEIPTLFSQATSYSTSVGTGVNAPNLSDFASGIRRAHALGYHVFFVPLSKVDVPGDWAGTIQFSTQSQEQAWFDSYWNTLKPYATVAQENGVEQMSIGTELVWLEHNAPDSFWNELITHVQSVFKGTLTYDMNWWRSLYQPPANWLKNPALSMIGVSEYVSIVDHPEHVASNAMIGLWKDNVGKLIDSFSMQIGKKMIISEIGYRDTYDTFYNPYASQSSAPVDTADQAAAYDAAFTNIFADQYIEGVFCWGWNGVGRLDLVGKPAIQVLHKWYTALAA